MARGASRPKALCTRVVTSSSRRKHTADFFRQSQNSDLVQSGSAWYFWSKTIKLYRNWYFSRKIFEFGAKIGFHVVFSLHIRVLRGSKSRKTRCSGAFLPNWGCPMIILAIRLIKTNLILPKTVWLFGIPRPRTDLRLSQLGDSAKITVLEPSERYSRIDSGSTEPKSGPNPNNQTVF